MGIQHPHVGDPCPACAWAREHRTLDPCVRCNGWGRWEPDRDFGIAVLTGSGALEEESKAVRRLLVP